MLAGECAIKIFIPQVWKLSENLWKPSYYSTEWPNLFLRIDVFKCQSSSVFTSNNNTLKVVKIIEHLLLMWLIVQSVTGEREDLAKTRERFNEVFKKYTEVEKKKKVKKKRNKTQETIVVRVLIRAVLSSVDSALNSHWSTCYCRLLFQAWESKEKSQSRERHRRRWDHFPEHVRPRTGQPSLHQEQTKREGNSGKD